MRRGLLLMGVFAVLAAGIAQGKQCKGVSFPDQVQIEGGTLALNGLCLRQGTMLKVNVYVAALYLTKTSSDPNAILGANAPYELTLQFLRHVGASDVSEGWEEGFEKNAKGSLPALKDRIAMLRGWMGEMNTGQRLTYLFKPGVGVQVNVNGTVKGTHQGR